MAITVNYAAMLHDIENLTEKITQISNAINDPVNVSSLSGSTKSSLDTYIRNFQTAFDGIKPNIETLQNNIQEVHDAYKQKEQSAQEQLSKPGPANGANYIS